MATATRPPAHGRPAVRLGRAFFARDAEAVARDLVGAVLAVCLDGHARRARIVETEAYVGTHDLACHASRGRTPRTEVMFGPPGRAYVYLVYGLHDMLNVVTGAEGDAQAVLIRAAEPLDGLVGALSGPGRLTRTLGVTRQHNGLDLCGERMWLEAGRPAARVVATPRVGIDYAGVWADAPLRFLDAESTQVSRRSKARDQHRGAQS